jgi:urea transport system substrate-binding protein
MIKIHEKDRNRREGAITDMYVLARQFLAVLMLLWSGLSAAHAQAVDGEPIRIGILHSQSGTMALSEMPLVDILLMLIEEQNEAGGVLGRQLQPLVMDPASDDVRFVEMATRLLGEQEVDVVFGSWTSASRKAVLPVFEEFNRLLFYPVQYEGQESSRNIFYFGATPNQQAIPAVDYLLSDAGGGIRRWALVGTDYVYPRTTNAILRSYLAFNGIPDSDILEVYTPFGHADWAEVIADVRQFSNIGLPTAIISTVNGDANLPFYEELARQGVGAQDIPVMAFSVGEAELGNLPAGLAAGHLAAWNYFMSLQTDENARFIERWRTYSGDPGAITVDPMVGHLTGFRMWVQAVEQAGTTDTDAVRQAMYGQVVRGLSGDLITMTANHHTTKPVFIGRMQPDGQFSVIWSSDGTVEPDAWSDFLLESANLTADWRYPWVCGGCETPRFPASGE